MKTSLLNITLHIVFILLLTQSTYGQFTKLFDFSDSFGSYPQGSLINSGDTLFGTLQRGNMIGEETSHGSVFKINIDGSGYKVLYNFKDTLEIYPKGALVLKGSTLFGATHQGGSQCKGNLFKINTDGSGFKSIFSFQDSLGNSPVTPLLIIGDTIFGTAANGGKYNQGTIFRMDTSGSNFKKLMDLTMSPLSLTYFNNYLYGNCTQSFPSASIIYRIRTDGSGYEVIREFHEGEDTGPIPTSHIVLLDSSFYGGACAGNTNSNIYKIKPDGTGYEVIHSFPMFSNILPYDPLTYWEGYFFGIGSADNDIFKVGKEGNVADVIHSLNYEEGRFSVGSLLVYNDYLYGTTLSGGVNGTGVVYKYNLVSVIPSIQASQINITDIVCDQMKISWKRGNGTNCSVFMRKDYSDTFPISNNTQYSASSEFGKGSQIGNSGWYCVYNGKDSTVVISGIKPVTNYQVMVSEYNVALLKDEKYNVQPTADNPRLVMSPKCTQSIFFDVLPIETYGDPAFDLEGVSNSGLKVSYHSSNNNVAIIQDDKINILNVGTANITASQEGNDIYFAADNVIRRLTVNKALLKVTAVDTSRNQGEPNPVFRLKYSGFIGNENVNILSQQPLVTSTANLLSQPGSYSIVASGGQDEHYSFQYINGILTVNPVTSTVDINKNVVKIYPNPAQNHLYIENIQQPHCQVQISDLSGKILISTFVTDKCIDVSSLTKGLYLLKLSNTIYKFEKN